MRSMMKKVVLTVLACLLVCCAVSCGNAIKGDEAKAVINDFFDAVVAEDYDKAEELLHPSRPVDMEAFFLQVEQEESMDFQEGIEIERYTGFSTSWYDSSVDGSRYELSMRAKVGDNTVSFTVEIVRNEDGYGIYNVVINT